MFSSSQGSGSKRRILPAGVTISWPNLVPIAAMHCLCLLALDGRYFSRLGLYTGLFFAFVVAMLGINLCYHRVLTHRSLRLPRWLERCFVLCAVCCLEGPPGQWVATHRAHHQHADREQDPHSPRQSFLWAHVGWLVFRVPRPAPVTIYARDILKDPFYRWLQTKLAWAWIFLAHVLLIFAGGAVVGWIRLESFEAAMALGASLVIWGVIVRTVFVWHVTWSVNSLGHVLGYRNYEVRDTSRNNWLIGLVGTGEGWHNNHHADPASACNTHRWWELDLTWMVIRLLQALGLAHDVILPRCVRRGQRSNPGVPV